MENIEREQAKYWQDKYYELLSEKEKLQDSNNGWPSYCIFMMIFSSILTYTLTHFF